MKLVIKTSSPLSLAAAQELYNALKSEINFNGNLNARFPRSVSVTPKGVETFHYGSDTIHGTTYMEWDKPGSQAGTEDELQYVRILRVKNLSNPIPHLMRSSAHHAVRAVIKAH